MKIFRDAVRSKEFAISAEIFLAAESSAQTIAAQTRILQPYVDGVLVTDNQAAQLHMAPLAAASLVRESGVDPILEIAVRNKNRLAIMAELLGAGALGVSSLMLIRGNRVPDGFAPRPRAVFDVKPDELIAIASRIKADEHLLHMPDMFVGTNYIPHRPEPDWVPDKLNARADAGAQFLHSHLCMDAALLRDNLAGLVGAGLPRRLSILVKLAVLNSVEDARYLSSSWPNNRIPDELIERLAQAGDVEAEGVQIAAELIQELKEIPGISGVHLVATRNLATIPAALEAAGIGPAG